MRSLDMLIRMGDCEASRVFSDDGFDKVGEITTDLLRCLATTISEQGKTGNH